MGINSKETDEGVEFEIRVTANASKSALAGVADGRLRVRVSSPPVDGAANKEIIRFLAATFSVSRSRVKILSGERARIKRVLVIGVGEKELRELLG